MDEWLLLRDVVVLLVGCVALGGLLSRIGQSPLLGYLLGGMVLGGPGSLQLVESREEIEFLSELGVAMLLFSIGLEFSLVRLLSLGRQLLLAGWLQVGLTLLVFAGVGLALGLDVRPAVALGAMLSLSSTAVVLRILMERGELETPHGSNALGILLVQDMAVVPLALLLAFLGRESGDAGGVGAWTLVGGIIGLVVVLYILLHHVAARFFAALSHVRNRELVVLLAAIVALGSTWAAHEVGISPALGAFLAGMLLGGSPFATQIRADVAPARILLLTVFFGTAGMVADPLWIARNLAVVALASLVVVLLKLAVVATLLRAQRQTLVVALASGLTLGHVGEFAFVLASLARDGGLLSPFWDQLVISITIVTMVSCAFLVPVAPGLAARLARWMLRVESPRHVPLAAEPHVPEAIVVGFGPSGQFVARACADLELRTLVVDLNPSSLVWAREQGFQALFGDATQVEVLEHAEVSAARVVVVTIPHVPSAETIVEHVRAMAPLAQVIVRSRYQRDAHAFALAGAHVVVGDEEQVGLRLAEVLAEWRQANPAQGSTAQSPEGPAPDDLGS